MFLANLLEMLSREVLLNRCRTTHSFGLIIFHTTAGGDAAGLLYFKSGALACRCSGDLDPARGGGAMAKTPRRPRAWFMFVPGLLRSASVTALGRNKNAIGRSASSRPVPFRSVPVHVLESGDQLDEVRHACLPAPNTHQELRASKSWDEKHPGLAPSAVVALDAVLACSDSKSDVDHGRLRREIRLCFPLHSRPPVLKESVW